MGAILTTAALAPAASAATTDSDTAQVYRVDCSAPAGSGDGSVNSPWSTLAQANAHTFGPGDHLLLARGTTCVGTLATRGSGSADAPFTIGAYGRGAKPHIDGAGAHDAVLIENAEYVHVTDLDISNAANAGSERNGLRLWLHDFGVAHGISVENLDIHDVLGGDVKGLTGSSGIQVAITGSTVPTAWDDLQITDNTITHVDREGIYFKTTWAQRDLVGAQLGAGTWGPWTPSTGVRVAGNKLQSIAGDGIKLDATTGAVIEHNRVDGFQVRSPSYNAGIWTFNTDDTVLQYNEVSGGGNTMDGMSFDADGGSRNTTFRYNYSHDNAGGFLLLCSQKGAQVVDTFAHDNVSHDDGGSLISTCGSPIFNAQIRNNTFYNDTVTPKYLFAEPNHSCPEVSGCEHDITVSQNILQGPGTGGYGYLFLGPRTHLMFDHNVVFGIPALAANPDGSGTNPGGITADPLLAVSVLGTDPADLSAYRLAAHSPAFGLGDRTASPGAKDLYGFAYLPNHNANAGAYQGPPAKS